MQQRKKQGYWYQTWKQGNRKLKTKIQSIEGHDRNAVDNKNNKDGRDDRMDIATKI